jgi:hypothetical protein
MQKSGFDLGEKYRVPRPIFRYARDRNQIWILLENRLSKAKGHLSQKFR